MTRHGVNRSNILLLAGALLVALLFQAMIPAGFMPATDGSFALQICHSGFPSHAGAHDPGRHSGGHSHVEFCPFGALPGAAPISHGVTLLASGAIASQPVAEFEFRRPCNRLERAHPPRGPPAFALS